ncbi:MAG: dioxygenase [Oscillatoriales cyanobacterium SM2_2_1]|nr:dioxygenase [Oscillatoriales cyanobacterium SM2_2_1]
MELPSLFISHGSPDLATTPSPARSFLMGIGNQFEKPKAILVISAHWTTKQPQINSTERPQTIHDFWGFPQELYQMEYPANTSRTLTQSVANLLKANEFEYEIIGDRGFDHGVWNPLMLMYPSAAIPIVQLSVQPRQDPSYHFRLGQALTPLRSQGILIIGSGSATHNLREMGRYEYPPNWVTEFMDWLNEKVMNADLDALFNYLNFAPYAKQNHPTPEHLLPLFVAMGAAGISLQPFHLHSSYTYDVLSMDAFAFN